MKKLITVAVIAGLAVAGYSYSNHYAGEKAKEAVDKQVSLLQKQTGMSVSYDDLSVNVLSEKVTLNAITIKDENGEAVASIDMISAIGLDEEEIPEHSETTIKGLKFSQALLKKLPQSNALLEASYDLHSEVEYEKDSGELKSDNKITIGDIAKFKMDFDVTNTTAFIATAQEFNALEKQREETGTEPTLQQQLALQSKLMDSLSQLVPQKLELEIKNKGELKSTLEQLVEQNGMSYSQFQQMAEQQLAFLPLPQNLKDGVSNFLTGTEKLEIKAKLPEDISIKQMNEKISTLAGQPEELGKFLNLEVEGK